MELGREMVEVGMKGHVGFHIGGCGSGGAG